MGVIILLAAAAGQASAQGIGASAQAAISHYRQEHGLGAVRLDPKLMQLAEEQARAMARAGVMEHDVERPFAARIARYNPDLAVENIAAGTVSFASTLDLWKHSPGHNANLLNAGVTRLGIAAADAPQSHYHMFWSLIMAKPAPPRRPGKPAVAVLGGAVEEPVVRVRTHWGAPAPNWLSGLSGKLRGLLGQPAKESGAAAH